MNLLFWSISSTFIWYGVYRCLRLLVNKDIEYISRIYSNIHAIFILYGSFLELKNDSNIIAKYGAFTCGYAIFDMYRSLKKKELDYIIHHSLIIIGTIPFILEQNKLLILPKFYRKFIALNYLSESSTIFLNICWLILKNGGEKSKLFKINAILTLVCFFIFRIVNFTYISINLIDYKFLFMLQGILTGLNYNWFYKLIKKYKEMY